jgi:hypothetical protein
MFSPHKYSRETGEFRPLSEGVEISGYYSRVNLATAENADQNIDSWERFFQRTKIKYENGLDVTEECGRICDIMLTRTPRMRRNDPSASLRSAPPLTQGRRPAALALSSRARYNRNGRNGAGAPCIRKEGYHG